MIITMTDNNSNDYMMINDDYNGYDNNKINNNKYDNNDQILTKT